MIEGAVSSYLVGVGVEYGEIWLDMNIFSFNRLSTLPINSGSSIYGYLNTSNSSLQATGRSFAVLNYVLKIPPNSWYGYNLQAGKT